MMDGVLDTLHPLMIRWASFFFSMACSPCGEEEGAGGGGGRVGESWKVLGRIGEGKSPLFT